MVSAKEKEKQITFLQSNVCWKICEQKR